MRTSHQLVRKRILDEKSKITDEEFFTSKEYQAYLTDISEAATKRYKHPMPVRVVADHDDKTLAFTDFHGVFINACNEITWSMPSRQLRSLSIEGLDSHENSHNLFTDRRIWNALFAKLEKGKFYPKLPKDLTLDQKRFADEILEVMADDDDPVPKMVVLDAVKALSNILEDGYVDARYSYEFPGMPARGIALNNLRIAEKASDITTMINKKMYDHNIVLNMLIQYVNAGEVNNLSGYTGEFMDKLSSYVPIVDACVYDEDPRARCEAVNYIAIDLWPMMQRCFDDLRDKMRQQPKPQNGSGGGQQSPSGGGGAGDSDDEDDQKAVQNALQSQRPQTPESFQGKGKPVPSTGSFVPDPEQTKQLKVQVERVLAEETARIAAHYTAQVTSTGDGGLTSNTGYSGNGYGYAAEDIERVLEEMATGRVHEAMEEELSEELQREADTVSYGNAHRNIHVTVNRMAHVDQEYINSYNAVAPKLLMLSKRLQQSVSSVLNDLRRGGKQTGLYVGKRLNQHAMYRDDGRVFYNTRLPTEPINMAVALLVDESGSMAGNDRITRARATSIVVQDFCEKLGIPIMIMGHTAWGGHVELFSYSEFDSVDKKDRYRLMDMSARSCNRDGAALRFVAEKLNKQNAEVKLLLIICDGQPNDDGYSGTAAEADLRGIKQEYARKGVQIFAAAIGDDRDRIERIYGTGYLDITDLNELPVMLTSLISRNLPH